MRKLITTLVLGTAMSFGVLQAVANEPALRIGYVDVIAMNTEQAVKLRQERVLYKAAVDMLMAMGDSASQQSLEAINKEYERRIDSIINNEAPAQYRRSVRAPGVIY